MINLEYIKNQKFSKIQMVQLLFYTLPLSFIIGNFIVSLHLLLFLIISLFFIKKEQIKLRFKKIYWILIVFFSYFFLITTFQFQTSVILNDAIKEWSFESNPVFKSFLLFRFLLLVVVVDTLFFNKLLNFKKFFLVSLICTSFVSLDVILQYVTGTDLFGYKSVDQWLNAGPFGDERIAGSYLQQFSFLSIFSFFEIIKNKKFNKLFFVFIIVLHLVAILFAGNRMPTLLFLLGSVIVVIFIKEIRFKMISGLLVFATIFFIVIKNDENIKKTYINLWTEMSYAKKLFDIDPAIIVSQDKKNLLGIKKPEEQIDFLRTTGHGEIFRTALAVWKKQPLFGNGLKSFRILCWTTYTQEEIDTITGSQKTNVGCSNHPHNYYLEILSDSGIIGIGLMLIFFLILFKDSILYLIKFNNIKETNKYLLAPIIIIFFMSIWPLKSSGSFFTNWGATIFWLNIAMLLALNFENKTNK